VPKPNLFVVGSMKSGTSYLWRLLDAHPLVFMSEPKEPCYFVDPEDLRRLFPLMWRQQYWKSERAYLDLFNAAETAPIIGEASVFYAYLPLAPGVADRIRQFNPDARILYLMRDPVERALSHYWHNVRYFGEYRSLDQAIKNDIQYAAVGDYAVQLREYYRHFDPSNVLVLTYEELIEDPASVMETVFDWLGVGPAGRAPQVPPQNVTPEQFNGPIWKWQRLRQRHPVVRRAIDRLPKPVRRFGASLVTRQVRPADADVAAVADYLRPLQLQQTDALADLLGRDFPQWTTLYRPGEPAAAARVIAA
jgi:sulfotransferase family protein